MAKKILIGLATVSALAIAATLAVAAEPQSFVLSQNPLFLSNPAPNVLLLLDNSNSFDENTSGVPVGSGNNNSKSVIARTALRNIVANYYGKINLGLMDYKLTNVNASDVDLGIYDASYDPSTYDPTFTPAQGAANNWEAFPFTSWGATPYTGTYGGPMTCAAPFLCPWGGVNPPGQFAGINWNVAPWNDSAWTGERRGQKLQYQNLGNTSSWWIHPYDFVYFNLLQADYGNGQAPQYCYSTDAVGLHGHGVGSPINPGNLGVTGGEKVRCFPGKTGPGSGYYPEGILNANGVHISPKAADETHYGFTGAFAAKTYIPTDSDYAQGFTTFGRDLDNLGNSVASIGYPASPSYFSFFTGGLGDLLTPIQPLTVTQTTVLNNLLQCNIPSTWANGAAKGTAYVRDPYSTTACTTTGVKNAGGTPSPGALLSALHYFTGALTAGENGTGVSLTTINTIGAAANNLPNSCNKNYVIFVTDGMPTHKTDGTLYATPAMALDDTVIAAKNLATNAGNPILVYVIGFGSEVQQAGLDQIAAAGGTTASYSASDAASLNVALSAVFNDVIVRSASAASVATNSAQFSVNTALYQARFTSADWTGQILKYETDNTTGAVAAIPDFDAGQVLNSQDWHPASVAATRRQLITAKRPGGGDPAGNSVGIPFAWPVVPSTPTPIEMFTWQSTALNKDFNNALDSYGTLRVDWLRGDHSNEGTASPLFRARSTTVLGDIVNSFPVYEGAPSASIDGGASYFAYRTLYKSRTPVVVVGANDGMFHIFDANNGQEILGFLPSHDYKSNPESGSAGSRLSQLTRLDYKSSHTYIDDASPTVAEAYFGSNWHTVAVSGAGAGGQNVFALNISNTSGDSSKPDPALNEANAASILLWEFGDKNTNTGTIDASGNPTGVVNGDPDLGATFSVPVVGLANNGKWVAIFGNGYNNNDADGSASTTGYAALYVVDVASGALIRKIPVPVGTTVIPNGLGTVRSLDADLNGTIDYVYAGDLYGNIWKFDLTSATPSSWTIALSGNPLFTVNGVGGAGNRRPITGELRIAPDPNGGYRIMFGTGRYLATATVDLPSVYDNTSLDALYSVWDTGMAVANGRSWLTAESLQAATVAGGNTYRQLTSNVGTQCTYGNNPTTQPGCVMGCYVDLKDYPTAGYDGERFTYFPQLSAGLVTFNTIIPSTNICSAGGNTEEVAFNYLTCTSPVGSPFDVNGDGSFNGSDLVSFGGSITAPGSKLLSGITPPGTRVYNPATGITYVYNSSSLGGSPTLDKLRTPTNGGRVSWRQLDKNEVR